MNGAKCSRIELQFWSRDKHDFDGSFNMVVSRNGSLVINPCIKESKTTSHRRPITKRIAELPSLRYGAVGAKTTFSGPLRVCGDPSKSHRGWSQSRAKAVSYPQTDSHNSGRTPRRVRFSLPPTDGGKLRDDEDDDDRDVHDAVKTRDPPPWRRRPNNFSKRWNAKRNDSADRDKEYLPSALPKRSTLYTEEATAVPVTISPGVRNRIHPTCRYVRGTLSPTSNAAPQATASPGGQALLKAAREGDDHLLKDLLRRAALVGIPDADLNAVDNTGRTLLSYIASNGSIDLLEIILHIPGLDPNKPDNEGNTPLHFAAQAGQIECLNCLLSRCRGVEIDARNYLGFTPLMKAALQGRNKCAKLLLFAGANPTLRDNGRSFRADQWARFCGRYVCADVIEKHARQRLLERSTSYGNWGIENDIGSRVVMGKVMPVPPIPQPTSNGLKSKLRKVFRTSSGPTSDTFSSARLVTQLTSAALCASSPVLPSGGSVPPVVKSLIRPLTVPRLQITLVNNNGDYPNNNLTNNGVANKPTASSGKPTAPIVTTINEKVTEDKSPPTVAKPLRTKKKK